MSRVESKIQADIIAYLRGLPETYVLNLGGGASMAKGSPDLIVCHRGLFIALEVKRPKEDSSYGLTSAQAIRLSQIRKAGGIGGVVCSIADTAQLLRTIKE